MKGGATPVYESEIYSETKTFLNRLNVWLRVTSCCRPISSANQISGPRVVINNKRFSCHSAPLVPTKQHETASFAIVNCCELLEHASPKAALPRKRRASTLQAASFPNNSLSKAEVLRGRGEGRPEGSHHAIEICNLAKT